MFEDNPLAAELPHPAVPMTLVIAQDDLTAPAEDLLGLAISPSVQIRRLPGGHLLPLTSPEAVRRFILADLGASEA